jgi:RNA polymerase sigma-70 factor (ECF subfamily)
VFISERRFRSGQSIIVSGHDVDNILQQYAKMVYRLAYLRTKNGADADDVVQEVFMRYIKSHIHFNSEEHCKAWFIKVTVNCSKSLLASAWFRKTTSLKDNLLDRV